MEKISKLYEESTSKISDYYNKYTLKCNVLIGVSLFFCLLYKIVYYSNKYYYDENLLTYYRLNIFKVGMRPEAIPFFWLPETWSDKTFWMFLFFSSMLVGVVISIILARFIASRQGKVDKIICYACSVYMILANLDYIIEVNSFVFNNLMGLLVFLCCLYNIMNRDNPVLLYFLCIVGEILCIRFVVLYLPIIILIEVFKNIKENKGFIYTAIVNLLGISCVLAVMAAICYLWNDRELLTNNLIYKEFSWGHDSDMYYSEIVKLDEKNFSFFSFVRTRSNILGKKCSYLCKDILGLLLIWTTILKFEIDTLSKSHKNIVVSLEVLVVCFLAVLFARGYLATAMYLWLVFQIIVAYVLDDFPGEKCFNRLSKDNRLILRCILIYTMISCACAPFINAIYFDKFKIQYDRESYILSAYLINYQTFGFCQRGLIGSIFHIVSGGIFVKYSILIILLLYCFAAYFIAKFLLKMAKQSNNMYIYLFIMIFLVSPMYDSLFTADMLGRIDLYYDILAMGGILLISQTKRGIYYLPLIISAMLLIHQISFLMVIPSILMVLLWEIIENNQKKSYIVMGIVALLCTLIGFIYIQFFSNYYVKIDNLSKACKILEAEANKFFEVNRGEIELLFTNTKEHAKEYSNLITKTQVIDTCTLYFWECPLVALFIVLFNRINKTSIKKQCRWIYLLGMVVVFSPLPVYAIELDYSRWTFHVFFQMCILICYLGTNRLKASDGTINNRKYQYLIYLIYILQFFIGRYNAFGEFH